MIMMMEQTFVKCFISEYEDPVRRILDLNFWENPVETDEFRKALDSGNVRELYRFWMSDMPISSTFEKAFGLVKEHMTSHPSMYDLLIKCMHKCFLLRMMSYGFDYDIKAYIYAALNNGAEKLVERDEFTMFKIRQMKYQQKLDEGLEGRLNIHSKAMVKMLEHIPIDEERLKEDLEALVRESL